ncbi:MAG: MFS transporter [Sandaracinaceae bacterium]|nr:MFS transporter [Sandaracinaceae bacterium]
MRSPASQAFEAPLVVLAPLYLAQGLPFGLFTQTVPVLLRQRGMSLEIVGASALLALPWALKPLLAPLVDRRGSRHAWIIPLQLASAALLFGLSFSGPAALTPIVLASLVANALAATQDIATDALAVESLPPAQRGIGNGVQVAAYRVGMMVGGGALLYAIGHLGWAGSLRLASVVSVLVLVPLVLSVRHRARASRATPAAVGGASAGVTHAAGGVARRTSAGALLESARHFGLPWMILLGLYKLGDGLATNMLRPALVDRGHSLASIGSLLGGIGFGCGLAGALIGGACVRAIGHGRALIVFGALQAIGIASYTSIGVIGPSLPIALEHVTSGMATAALFTAMMSLCRLDHAAVDYTLQAGVVVIATGAGAALGGPVAHALGYEACFASGAVLSVFAVILVLVSRRSRSMARLAGMP